MRQTICKSLKTFAAKLRQSFKRLRQLSRKSLKIQECVCGIHTPILLRSMRGAPLVGPPPRFRPERALALTLAALLLTGCATGPVPQTFPRHDLVAGNAHLNRWTHDQWGDQACEPTAELKADWLAEEGYAARVMRFRVRSGPGWSVWHAVAVADIAGVPTVFDNGYHVDYPVPVSEYPERLERLRKVE